MKHTEHLKYTFSEEELRDFAKELARENTAVAEAEEQKKAVVAQFGERAATAKTKISMLSRYISNGCDYRLIDCDVLMHVPEIGQKSIVRCDTGETVRTRAMTDEELQETLPFAASEGR